MTIDQNTPYAGFWRRFGATLIDTFIAVPLLGILLYTVSGGKLSKDALSIGRALLRYFGYLVSALLLMLGFVWIAFDRRKQGFHDKIAGSVVVIEHDAATARERPQPESR